MKKHDKNAGLVDMDRLSRIFTWLVAVMVTLVLGMVFDQVILADSALSVVTFQQSGVPFTLNYPTGWSAGFDRSHDLVVQAASSVAAASDSMLILNDSPITQISGIGEGYLVTLGKISPNARAPFDAMLTDPTAKSITVNGATKAVKKSGIVLNTGIETEVVMTVGTDLYVMDLMTTRGSTDVSKTADYIVSTLKFTN